MGIYITDMEMPKDGYRQLFLTAEGEVIYFPSTPKNGEVRKKAIVVPNHGDLIDRDALDKTMQFIGEAEAQIYGSQSWGFAMKCRKALYDAPTVIPASKEGE